MNYAKPLIVAATLLASSVAYSAVIPEGSYPEVAVASRADQQANVQAARGDSVGVRGWLGEGRPDFRPYSGPQASRAAVISDRNDWQASGLARLSQAAEPAFATPDYQQRLDQYGHGGRHASAE